MNPTPIEFQCNMCGERHNKILPMSTDLTACHRCGNLINISHLQKIQRRRNRRNNFNYDDEDDYYNNNYENEDNYNNNYLDDDFYDFDRYESHEDYLPNPNRRNPSFNRNNNNNNRRRQGDNRPFVNSNRNRNNSSGMFQIQIPNDSYNRISAFSRRSNFGVDGNINNIFNLLDEFNFEDELNYDLDLMSRERNVAQNNNINLINLNSLFAKPEKEKIKLKKIKMSKKLYTKNENGKIEQPTCCICLATMKVNDDIVLLKCQHYFHFKCLDKWVETKEECPFCRGKIEFGKVKDVVDKMKKEDKKIEDKKIEDKKVEDKKIEEDKKVEDKKVEDKKVEDKKIEDKKINKPIIKDERKNNFGNFNNDNKNRKISLRNLKNMIKK